MSVDRRITSTAVVVRRNVVRWMENHPSITSDLQGACAIASYTLWLILRAKGIPAVFVLTAEGCDAHCWIETQGHIVDITATQFGGPEIAITPLTAKRLTWNNFKWVYGKSYRLENSKALARANTWDDQSPKNYNKRIKSLVKKCSQWEVESIQTYKPYSTQSEIQNLEANSDW